MSSLFIGSIANPLSLSNASIILLTNSLSLIFPGYTSKYDKGLVCCQAGGHIFVWRCLLNLSNPIAGFLTVQWMAAKPVYKDVNVYIFWLVHCFLKASAINSSRSLGHFSILQIPKHLSDADSKGSIVIFPFFR